MSILEQVIDSWPVSRWSGTTILVAVSGGPDSVALLRVLHLAIQEARVDPGTQLVIAHYNHCLRGAESDADAQFVLELGSQLGLETVIESAAESSESDRSNDDRNSDRANSVITGKAHAPQNEATWRSQREAFFHRIAHRMGASWIATAATADDTVETMLHNLLRGSGPAGLAGIRFERRITPTLRLVHPFLGVWKHQVLQFLDELRQSYRTDSSNRSGRFTRNRIRNECIPWLENFVGSKKLKERLWTASQLIREEHGIIESLASHWIDTHGLERHTDGVQVDWKELAHLEWPILQAILVQLWHLQRWPLQELGFKHWQRLRSWFEKAKKSPHPQRIQLPGSIELTIRRGTFRAVRRSGSLDLCDSEDPKDFSP